MTVVATSTEIRDSTALSGGHEALRARIAADGYVFVRGLLDPATVGAVGREGLSRLQEAGWTDPGADPVAAGPRLPVRAVRMRDAFGDRGYRRILADPGFTMIPFASPLADLMG